MRRQTRQLEIRFRSWGGRRAGAGRKRSNGLARLAGTWTEEEHRQFEAAIAVTAQIDAELWR